MPEETAVYKYRALITEEDRRRTEDILRNHRLWAADPATFNDLFDCKAEISFEATPDEKRLRAFRRIKSENRWIPDSKALELAEEKYRYAETLGQATHLNWLKNGLGIVSLAGNHHSHLLWAHYAASHNGVCIEFCATQESHADFLGQCLPVRYQTERPTINFYKDEPIDIARRLTLTKAKEWDYEAEYRILVFDRRKTPYFSFDPTIVRAVYLGTRITNDNRTFIGRILAERSVKPAPLVYQARPSEMKYEIEYDLINT